MSTPISPLADRIVAVREKAEAKTVSGLYLPDNAKEKPAYAVVEAISPDVKSVKAGDKVVFKEYTTTEIKINDVEYLIVKEEDVLAKLVSA
jgi:chaperonin GroES